jgi:hypothetical protein
VDKEALLSQLAEMQLRIEAMSTAVHEQGKDGRVQEALGGEGQDDGLGEEDDEEGARDALGGGAGGEADGNGDDEAGDEVLSSPPLLLSHERLWLIYRTPFAQDTEMGAGADDNGDA